MTDKRMKELAERTRSFLLILDMGYKDVTMDEPLKGLYKDMLISMAEFVDYAYGEMEKTGDDHDD